MVRLRSEVRGLTSEVRRRFYPSILASRNRLTAVSEVTGE